jgi:hypothetical protein
MNLAEEAAGSHSDFGDGRDFAAIPAISYKCDLCSSVVRVLKKRGPPGEVAHVEE